MCSEITWMKGILLKNIISGRKSNTRVIKTINGEQKGEKWELVWWSKFNRHYQKLVTGETEITYNYRASNNHRWAENKNSLSWLQLQIAARSEDRERKKLIIWKLPFKLSLDIEVQIEIERWRNIDIEVLFSFCKKTMISLKVIFIPTSPLLYSPN